jgi:hypothetical protein
MVVVRGDGTGGVGARAPSMRRDGASGDEGDDEVGPGVGLRRAASVKNDRISSSL